MLVVVSNTKYGREKKTADWVMWRTLSCWLGWLWSVWYFDHRVRVFTKWGHFLNPRKDMCCDEIGLHDGHFQLHGWLSPLGRVGSCLMPQSHQTFHPVSIVKLLGIMFRKGCWFTAFHTITTGDADGWCQKWPVCSVPQPVSNCDPPSLSFPSFRIGVEMQKL